MSISGNYKGGISRPFPVRLTTTSATDIVTGYDSSQIIAGFSLANETGSPVVVACHYFDGATDFLVFRRSVPATDTVVVSDIPLRLHSGAKFKATAATGNAITVTPVVLENHPNEIADGTGRAGVGR